MRAHIFSNFNYKKSMQNAGVSNIRFIYLIFCVVRGKKLRGGFEPVHL